MAMSIGNGYAFDVERLRAELIMIALDLTPEELEDFRRIVNIITNRETKRAIRWSRRMDATYAEIEDALRTCEPPEKEERLKWLRDAYEKIGGPRPRRRSVLSRAIWLVVSAHVSAIQTEMATAHGRVRLRGELDRILAAREAA